jgi:hypothetical protein
MLHRLASNAAPERKQRSGGNMSKVKRIDKLEAASFFCEEADRRRALYDLADAFSYREEPCAAKLRDAIETLDFTDPADAWHVFEDTDPCIIAVAVNVLVALVANELGWGRNAERQRN